MRNMVFAARNRKELLRDPVSYLFGLGLPLMLLLLFSIINASVPANAQVSIFQIGHIAPGITVFSFTFLMLFASLQVSKDRSSSFLTRLYATPMTAYDFIIGYTLPLLTVGLGQCIVTFLAAVIIGAVTGTAFSCFNIFLSILALMPSAFLFIGFGLLFGSLFSEKSAPAMASMVITVSSILGGVWMDIDTIGGVLKQVCIFFPFYHGVQAARAALTGKYSEILLPFLIVCLYAFLIFTISIITFQKKMQHDVS